MSVNKNPEIIKNMFNDIADVYDKNNNIISLGLHKTVKQAAIKELNITDKQKILDLCCGSGDIISIILAKHPDINITGVDFSENMLSVAMKNCIGGNVTFINADAASLPLEDDSFDIITMFFGLRNIENRNAAISEIKRVLKNEGEFLHLDFGRKNIFSNLFDYIAILGIKFFYGNKLPYRYLISSKKEFPVPEDLIKEFEQAGFSLKKRKDFLFGIISMQIFTI